MALTFIQQPTGIYPAYNDSYIEFTSDLAGNNKAEITIYPTAIFTRVFVIYPNLQGSYIFNLIDVLKVAFNASGLDDKIDTSLGGFMFGSVAGLIHEQNIQIKVKGTSGEDSVNASYFFFRGVKQIGETIHSNDHEVLTYSKDGATSAFTYFEGFPFFFDLKYIQQPDSIIKIKSLNNLIEQTGLATQFESAYRIVIDKSEGNNWTSQNFIPLIEGVNRLEIYVDGVFANNLNITKKKSRNGVYLKWLNRNGSYSFYLFNEFYNLGVQSKEIGRVFQDQFQNFGTQNGNKASIGKTGKRTIAIKAKYDTIDYQNLVDIYTSPSVQLYTSTEANIKGTWIDVFVVGTMTRSNKKNKNDISMSVELPEVTTIKL